MFDECGNEVEGNKEVIELAVYIALGRTLLVKCRDSLGTWNLRQLKFVAHLRNGPYIHTYGTFQDFI